MENKIEKQKWKFTILGISIWKLFAYFIIYSLIGYVIEMCYGALTKGVLESRQSFLYGPFCGIYGLGAVVMIIFLQYFSKNIYTLFVGGFIIGGIVEYSVSLFGELVFNVKWWDYSNMPLNIHGRVCVSYSVFWGLLGIYLMRGINPIVDKWINKITEKFSYKGLKTITAAIILFLLINCIITGIALNLFLVRMIAINDVDVKNKAEIKQIYDRVYSDEKLADFIYKYWGDRKMIRTFPNIKVEDTNKNMVYMDSLLQEIQPYYYKFHYYHK